MHPHRLWEREVIVPGFVDEDLVVSRQVLAEKLVNLYTKGRAIDEHIHGRMQQAIDKWRACFLEGLTGIIANAPGACEDLLSYCPDESIFEAPQRQEAAGLADPVTPPWRNNKGSHHLQITFQIDLEGPRMKEYRGRDACIL